MTWITGIDFQPKAKKGATEDNETDQRHPNFPQAGSDEDLSAIKEKINDDKKYYAMEKAFKKLWGTGDKQIPNTSDENIPFLVE